MKVQIPKFYYMFGDIGWGEFDCFEDVKVTPQKNGMLIISGKVVLDDQDDYYTPEYEDEEEYEFAWKGSARFEFVIDSSRIEGGRSFNTAKLNFKLGDPKLEILHNPYDINDDELLNAVYEEFMLTFDPETIKNYSGPNVSDFKIVFKE